MLARIEECQDGDTATMGRVDIDVVEPGCWRHNPSQIRGRLHNRRIDSHAECDEEGERLILRHEFYELVASRGLGGDDGSERAQRCERLRGVCVSLKMENHVGSFVRATASAILRSNSLSMLSDRSSGMT